MTDENNEELIRQKNDLKETLEIVIDAINGVARSVKDQEGKTADKIKQLKELTGAAKELYALMSVLSADSSEDVVEDTRSVRVCFEGGDEKWGK